MARGSPRFRDYFQDELDYLEQRSQEFAQANPDIAADLHLRDLKDPDVAMLLKGFAFLSGRIRQSLDAEFPELLYPLMAQLWPHALRPTPAATVVARAACHAAAAAHGSMARIRCSRRSPPHPCRRTSARPCATTVAGMPTIASSGRFCPLAVGVTRPVLWPKRLPGS